MSWPGPILALFLKKNDRKTVVEATKDPDGGKQRDRLCEAHFFLAEYELLADVQQTAGADFQQAVDTCRPTVVEYSAATVELKRLAHGPPSRLDVTEK